MADFYRVKIGNVYLTKDGSSSGLPCRLSVPGADALLSNFTGSVIIAIDGTPIVQSIETGTKGKPLEIRVDVLTTAIWQQLVAVMNTALSSETAINLIGNGDIGNFDVEARPFLPRPFEASEFTEGRIYNAIFRFVTT